MNPDTPRDETAIWRYMDLTKFVAMLASNTLWFAKMAEFHDDPFEGFCTVEDAAKRPAGKVHHPDDSRGRHTPYLPYAAYLDAG